MPKIVASYLKLKDAESYTCHTFRRTSATLLADSGADLLTLKRHGCWKSSAVAEGYIEDSITSKAKIAKKLSNSVFGTSGSSIAAKENIPVNTDFSTTSSAVYPEKETLATKVPICADNNQCKIINLNISNCNNLTINLEANKNP